MSTSMWTLRRAWGQGHPDRKAQNIGTATTVSHRVEKQRFLKNFIMENLLTATNNFQFEDHGANNIYTCNYNGTNHNRWGLIATIKSKREDTSEEDRQETPLDGNVVTVSVTTMMCKHV